MREVYIIGIGQTDVTKGQGSRGRYLAKEAIEKALEHAGIDKELVSMLIVGNMMSGLLGNQQQQGALIADISGLRGVEAATVETACSSGASAARWGFMCVSGNIHDCVIVCGVERMSHAPMKAITSSLATAADYEIEGVKNDSFVSMNARLMKMYMEKYNVNSNEFGHFSITAHKNAMTNPHALLKKRLDRQMYLDSKILIDPIKLFDAPPTCDGSATIILANKDIAMAVKAQGVPIVKIAASAVGTDSLSIETRYDKLEFRGAKLSCERAYKHSSTKPEDMDIFELHDAFTIITALSLEAAGFADKGKGVHFGKNGEIELNGSLPISTFGGLKARGHPVGATGIYQLVETYKQLSGIAKKNQVLGEPQLAMVQNIGGIGATVVSHILERV